MPQFSVQLSTEAFDELPALAHTVVDEFANLEDAKDGRRLLGPYAPAERDAARRFFASLTKAHSFTRWWLTGAIHGSDDPLPIDALRITLPGKLSYEADADGLRLIWQQDFPSALRFCGYTLAVMRGLGEIGHIYRCELEECRRFFWRPPPRFGPRPRYCCPMHRERGAQRESRARRAKRRRKR